MKNILVTGSSGFIGFHLSQKLLERGFCVFGLDNQNAYYDRSLKVERQKILLSSDQFTFYEKSLEDKESVIECFERDRYDAVINLGAQAGVRYSLENPDAYISSNIVGFQNILECCRNFSTKHLIYASTSSVYGANEKQPFETNQTVEHPLTLYAATKKSNELMAHSYSHLFGLPTTGLRFFTVYGPWGRPDMALFLFTKAMLDGEPIKVFNHGKMFRDFTYVDDISESIVRLVDRIPSGNRDWDAHNPNPADSLAPYRIFNIGNSQPVKLLDMIEVLESKLGIKAKKEFLPMQIGDVPSTHANVDDLVETTGFKPSTSLEEGIGKFVDWYKGYYKV